MVPVYRFNRVQRMKLVSYNIRFGLGLDQQIDLGRIADTVKDADIIALQEVERYWKHSGMTDQPEALIAVPLSSSRTHPWPRGPAHSSRSCSCRAREARLASPERF